MFAARPHAVSPVSCVLLGGSGLVRNPAPRVEVCALLKPRGVPANRQATSAFCVPPLREVGRHD